MQIERIDCLSSLARVTSSSELLSLYWVSLAVNPDHWPTSSVLSHYLHLWTTGQTLKSCYNHWPVLLSIVGRGKRYLLTCHFELCVPQVSMLFRTRKLDISSTSGFVLCCSQHPLHELINHQWWESVGVRRSDRLMV